jgi:2,5-furandicarboxylate decarboxylase 1
MVPADAEIIIEGRVPANHFEVEGPFGERPGYTGGQRPNPVIEVTAITYRRDAIWQSVFSGHPDTFLLGAFAIESQVYHRLKAVVPEVVNVHMPISTGCRDHVYVQVRKTRVGVGRQVAAALFSTHAKHAFVVDEDIDIFDERQVLWAIATRSQWDRDLIVMTGQRLTELDPSVQGQPGIGTKIALDCTMPAPPAPGLPSFYPPVSRVPRDVLDRLDLEAYASPEALATIPVE